jgi:hypothetical protein
MCDLAYVNLLREKVRQSQAMERRTAASGTSSSKRFVAWVLPPQLPTTTEPQTPPPK